MNACNCGCDRPRVEGPVIPYVVGLVFDTSGVFLALVEKKRPAWQVGRWNGCGGRVESGESPLQAMRRECNEEMLIDIPENDWVHLLTLHCSDDGGPKVEPGRQILFFVTHTPNIWMAQSGTDETVATHAVKSWHEHFDLMPNLSWIVPFALDPCAVLPLHVQDSDSRRVARGTAWPTKREKPDKSMIP